MLGGAVGDRTHAFLQRDVLGVDALDAGEAGVLLLGAVDEIIVREIGFQLERAGDVIVLAAAIHHRELLGVFVIERAALIGAIAPIVDVGLLVIDRHPD